MDNAPSFEIGLSDYAVHRLYPDDAEILQKLLEQCAYYVWIVEGEDVSPNAAEEIFKSAPPGRSLTDKFVFGLVNCQGAITGVLEVTRNYPEENIWWMGLMLLTPAIRKQGIGRKFLESFSKYVQANDGLAIMGGIVEDNRLAYKFWLQAGFEVVRQTEPRQFGKKMQAVYVIRRAVNEQSYPLEKF
ncbi:MAG: GNAT family N-acetyltransferase [Dissulfurispiraceae bacterium]